MPLRKISDLDLAGRRVFVRVDFNVPLTPAGGVADASRIEQGLPTLKHCLELGCKVVLGSHLGRPEGRPDPRFSMEPVAAYLADALRRDVLLTDEPAGDGAKKVVADLREGSVAVLENLGFSPGEASNDETFARTLAGYADVYINDAFGSAHLNHASTVGMVRHIGTRGMGHSFERDLFFFNQLRGEAYRPFYAVVGGTRVSEKFALMDNLLSKVDAIYTGGAVANTLLAAKGGHMGRSMREDDKLATARSFLRKADDKGVQIVLPRDLVAAPGIRSEAGKVVPALEVPEELAALDIGPETRRRYAEDLGRARTVFWTGPMGACEHAPFAEGTLEVARGVGRAVGATTVIAGNDSSIAIRRAGLAEGFSHVSVGGEGCFRYLEGKPLPGLEALSS